MATLSTTINRGEPQTVGTPKNAVVYRHFNRDGQLLYVGYSITFFARTMTHLQKSDWVKEVSRIELEHFPSREAATAAEQRAVVRELPLYNRNYTPLRRQTSKAKKRAAERGRDDDQATK